MFHSRIIEKCARSLGGVLKSTVTCYGTSSEFRARDKLYKTIELEIKSCEPAVMKSYQHFIKIAASLLNVTMDKVISAPKSNKKRFTVLKSVNGHRKHMVQYEIRTHYAWIHLKKITGSTADTFLEYIQRMLPEGVAMKVTKVSVEPIPSHLTPESIRTDDDDDHDHDPKKRSRT